VDRGKSLRKGPQLAYVNLDDSLGQKDKQTAQEVRRKVKAALLWIREPRQLMREGYRSVLRPLVGADLTSCRGKPGVPFASAPTDIRLPVIMRWPSS
jgi:hypothetical protein